jgi:2-keto-4-pentenoate hydratase/2-oxohepta-3-ene-1,7-dioic acid hydratase in catechol pathway
MKIVRFLDDAGREGWGQWPGGETAKRIQGDLFGKFEATNQEAKIAKLLAPVSPPNIICIGLNYTAHAAESGAALPKAPVIFLKTTTALANPGDPIVLPADAPDEVDYESELVIIIGKQARKVSEADALDYVLGYTVANDVSARDCQLKRDVQWARGKSFDTFFPIGPCLVTRDDLDGDNAPVRSFLNGEKMQDSNTNDMIFSCRHLISYLSHQFTLLPGTAISTGTPEGVGMAQKPPRFLRAGDTITVEVEGIGQFSSEVVPEA